LKDKWRLNPASLTKRCNPSIFNFTSTEEVKPLKGGIGQDRAIKSLLFGLDMEISGYNIYLSGEPGTGKTTMAFNLTKEKARKKPVPADWCYVYNFKNGDCPKAIKLAPKTGRQFRMDIRQKVDEVLEQIFKTLEGEDFDNQRKEIINVFVEETNKLYLQLEQETKNYGYTISKTPAGVNPIPLINGEPLSQDAYLSMDEKEKEILMRNGSIVQEKINETYRKFKEMEREVKEKVSYLERETANKVAEPLFAVLHKKYADYPEIGEYLKDMQEDIIEHLGMFAKANETPAPGDLFHLIDKRGLFKRYQVNLLVDNSELEHAPVIFCSNPTYTNLFGQIEYESEFGVLATDFTKIKAGAIHKANGGYLVLNMVDILKNFNVWSTLKRVLKDEEIVIESMSKNLGLINTETIQPEAIPVRLKVILIGEPIYYHLLYTQDEDFPKLFKIKADFDVEMPRTVKHMKEYAGFISMVCREKNLKHFTPQAVARMVEYGSRLVEDQNKLSTRFNRLAEIIYEADYWAAKEGKTLVDADDVYKAIKEKDFRSNMVEEKIQEYILQNSLLINVEGERIGELNGLAVYDMGDYSFGKPVRITAKTFMGEKGVINIEREIHLSGSIHSKGVLTLSGYLGYQYAQENPLGISASLTFEQSYGGIEGDSASSAELYALISSLAEVPLKQGIAVTGSVNQNGEIQPIGGVNDKIEGFYQVCKQKGVLNGQQGVIIPRQNVKQLVLDEEVINAVKEKKFNIWAIEHIDEGLEILTGIPAGQKTASGFTPGSIHFRADQKIKSWNNKRTRLEIHSNRSNSSGRKRGRRQQLGK